MIKSGPACLFLSSVSLVLTPFALESSLSNEQRPPVAPGFAYFLLHKHRERQETPVRIRAKAVY